MFKNQFKTAFRNLMRGKEYSLVNIVGLAVGIASCLLIVLFVQNELSYDKFFSNSDRIYKMALERKHPDYSSYMGLIPHSFAEIVEEEFAAVEKSTVLAGPFDNMLISNSYKNSRETKSFENFVFAADSNFFSVFSFTMLKGNRKTALQNPRSMVLTRQAAKRHFGNDDPIGRTLFMSGDNFVVTGVCEDPPANSHFRFNLIISINTIDRFNQENFTRSTVNCYLRLGRDANPTDLQRNFPAMVDAYASGEIEAIHKISWEEYKKGGNGYRYFLEPLASVHLDPRNLGGMKPGGNITYIQIFSLTAVLIFLIACINFSNLATAKSAERAREVGIRKTMGSSITQLIFQFLSESFLLSFIAVGLAIAIVYISMPYFNDLVGTSLGIVLTLETVSYLLLIVLFVAFFAGIYPAFVLSSFKPTAVLKGNFSSQSTGQWVRNGLVVFQFLISIILIICMLVIQQQMDFIQEKNLGFDKEQLVVIEGDFHMDANVSKALLNEIQTMEPVVSAASSLSVQGFGGLWDYQFSSVGSPEIFSFKTVKIGDGLPEVMGLALKEGRLFSEDTNDSLSVLVNESAVRALGLLDPVGSKLILSLAETDGRIYEKEFTIIGIVKDFHFDTLKKEIAPLIIQSNEIIFGRSAYVVARIKAGSNREAIAQIESKWKEMRPGLPFRFRFLDTVIDSFYHKEQVMGKMFALFSSLSILIAIVGLFSLSAYTVSLRTKEIAIRKVIGAQTNDIAILLSKNLLKIVLVSFLLAVPIAWYMMEKWWLTGFAYRTHINAWTILLTGAVAILMAVIAIGYHSVKAGFNNPITSLKQ